MKTIILFFSLFPLIGFASITGISTHPLGQRAKVLSAEMTGYMSQKSEMGMGLRYTQETSRNRIIDFSVSGAQEARSMSAGGGMDFQILNEKINQPRVSIKPFLQYQRFEGVSSNLVGAAPTLRKGFSLNGQEFFPYLAVPSGLKIDSVTDEFVYYASVSFGASMPLPGAHNDKILLTLESNKNLGASYDYLGCLVSWIWN